MNYLFPEWAQHPEPVYRMEVEDFLSDTERLADRVYAISRRDPEDFDSPQAKAALARFNIALGALLREIDG